ncbi:MAG: winged helix-turn-helix domain-containing protein [Euryarchaeota archaeon]|nr:winged helix-turn-helix domain-containing protein [Euryarchaeota archaeon]
MKNILEEFGINAGKIWETLNSQGPLTEAKLMQTTRLSDDEFYSAIGWLARENKICKDGMTYKLGETNLTDKIGANAGKIWTVLSSQKEVDITSIAPLAQIDKRDAFCALGWLARENKIEPKLIPRARATQIKIALKW